jgi:S1-C subfamily serine protease
MRLVQATTATARPLGLFGLLLLAPSFATAAPDMRHFLADAALVTGLRGQFGVPAVGDPNPTLPIYKGGPSLPYGTPGTYPALPAPFYTGGPTPYSFSTLPSPFFSSTFPAGQYSMGVFGNFVNQGMLIQQVKPGTPASRAGLQPGDLIVKIDGVNVNNQLQYDQVLSVSGGLVNIVVQKKNGQVQTFVVPLTAEGPRIFAPYMVGARGTFGVLGANVTKVYVGSPADKAGLKIGDQIVGINNIPTSNDAQFFQAVDSSSGKIYLVIRRGGHVHHTKIRLPLYRFGTLGTFNPAGAIVELVHPNSPAARVGIQPGDWIQQIDNKIINSQLSFENAISQSGGTSVLRVKKNLGVIGNVQVEFINNSLYCWCEPIGGGMRVLNLPFGGLAQKIGLNRGDIIVQVNNRPTNSLQQLQHALEHARGTLVVTYQSVLLPGQLQQININLGNFFV